MMAPDGHANAGDVRRLLRLLILEPEAVVNLPLHDLDLTIRVARRVRLHGRLCAHLKQAGLLDRLPSVAADQLESGSVMAAARARLARWELDRIAWALGSDKDTPLLAMKGCAYLLLDLPNTAGRIFADVDLMTAEDSLDAIEAQLNARGWMTTRLTPYDDNYYRKWTHELPPMIYREREVEVDLHHNILPRTARLKPSAAKLLAHARQLPGSRYGVLANEDMILHAMTHLMFDSDLADKLRDLVDIADLVAIFSTKDPAFWDGFIERATELNLTRPAFYSLRYASLLLDAEIPVRVLEATRRWAPPRIIVVLMDALVPRALFPQHPDRPSGMAEFSRFLLYMRSHWIRMPPWLLTYHLAYKFFATRIRRPA